MAQKKKVDYTDFCDLNRLFIALYILLLLGTFANSAIA